MDENSINQTLEEYDVTEDIDIAEIDVPIENVETEIPVEETVHNVIVEPEEAVTIDISESMGWVSGDDRYHDSLLGVDFPNQHPITAISNLKEELDDIKRLKTVYSDKFNVANYYEWNDAAYDEHGYFVSLVPNTSTIEICGGSDIFGVTVDQVAFIGGQDEDVPRDSSYGLVVTSGLVDIHCELDVEVGDHVVSNAYGYAKKSESDYGYKVLAKETKNGVEYAVIALGVQADITETIGEDLSEIDSRLNAAESNIVSAINVANEAFNKASECVKSNEEMSGQVNGALGVVGGLADDVEDLKEQISNSAVISAQAKAIAESAATSAESMRNEAIEKANEALADTVELRKELDATVAEMDTYLENAALELEAVKENLESTKNSLQGNIDDAVSDLEELAKDMEPLSTWPHAENPTGVAGFVARADVDSATLASIVTWKGDTGDSLAGFVQEATEENATVKSIASYKRKDANGNVVEPGGASGLTAQVDANQSELNAVASYEKDGAKGLAGIMAQVDENKSELSAVASYEKGDTKGLAGLVAQVDANKSELSTVASYEKDGKTGLAGLSAYVDEHESKVSVLTEYSNEDSGNSGVAGLVADVDDNTSTLSVVAQHSFTKDDGTVVTGLAGLQAQVEDNTSEVSLVANRVAGKYTVVDSWSDSDKNTSTVYYAKDTKLYWYYSNGWKNTADAYVAGLPASTAGIQVVADEHSSKINSLATFDTNTEINLARIEQKADANGAYIQSTVSNMDKYAVGPYSQAYGFTLEQAASVLEEGMIYVPTTDKIDDDKEIYSYIDTDGNPRVSDREFLKGYLYRWGELPSGLYGWITVDKNYSEDKLNTSAPSVYFSATEIVIGDNNDYGYWYTDGDTITGTTGVYEPYTLYKWESYLDESDTTQYHWVAVATLKGNSSNRAVSQIRQDANSIELRVTNTEGSAAFSKQWIDDNSANIQNVVSWKSDVEKDVSNIATIKSTADAASASIAQVVEAVGEDGEVTSASIITAINNDESSAVIRADKVAIEAPEIDLTGYVTFENLSTDGETTISGSNITTGTIQSKNYYYTSESWFATQGMSIDLTSGNIINQGFSIIDGSARFRGTITGSIISGGSMNINDNFAVDQDGNVTLKSGVIQSANYISGVSGAQIDLTNGTADITGTINAASGRIGGWTIDETGICTNSVGLFSGNSPTAPSLVSDSSSPIRFYAGKKRGTAQTFIDGTLNQNGIFETTITISEPSGIKKIKTCAIVGMSHISGISIGETSFSKRNVETVSDLQIKISLQSDLWAGETIEICLEYTFEYDISSSASLILEDGSFYSTAANIKGVINAEKGTIGGLKIDNGIKGYENDNEAFSLTSNGLYIDGNSASIQVGNFKTYYDSSTENTYWQTNGALYIQGVESGSPITSIELMTQEGKNSVTATTSLYARRHESNISWWIRIGANSSLYYPKNYTIYYQGGSLKLFGNIEWKEEINSITLSTDKEGYGVSVPSCTHIRFSTTRQGITSATAYYFEDFTDGSEKKIFDIETITQTSTKNDVVLMGNLIPKIPNTYTLGRGDEAWSGIYSQTGEIGESDRNKKNTIAPLSSEYETIFDLIVPVTYKFNTNSSDRTHTGFIAQDVKDAVLSAGITTKEFAAYCEWTNDDETIGCGLRYSEFIALCVDQIQKLKKRVTELEITVEKLSGN